MTRMDAATEVATTIVELAAKIRECMTMGRPADARDWAETLEHTANAYWNLSPEVEE